MVLLYELCDLSSKQSNIPKYDLDHSSSEFKLVHYVGKGGQ